MIPKRETPLLPVHSMKNSLKRSRRKGSLMRFVIMAAILFCVGYGLFASRYIGASKERGAAQDTYVRTQLERKSHVSGPTIGGYHEGRGLKAEAGSYSPRINTREHLAQHHIRSIHDRRRVESPPVESPVITDTDLYDEVIATGRNPRNTGRRSDAERDSFDRRGGDAAYAAHRDNLDVKQRVYEQIQQQHHQQQQQQHHQQQQQQHQPQLREEVLRPQFQQPQIQVQQQPQPQVQPQVQQPQPQVHVSSHADANTHPNTNTAPVIAGPVEADRQAELRRQSSVTAPSLAVGSRIEVDSHANDLASQRVVQPGASPVIPGGLREPTSERPAHVEAPITVTHTEPDSHQAQQQVPPQHEPILAQASGETDSSAHSVQHKAPEDVPAAVTTGGPVSGVPVAAPVTAPVTAPVVAPVVHAPVSPVTEPAVVQAPSPVVDATAQKVAPPATGLYALEAVDIDGKLRSLSEFAGKVTIVVNVASACGYTDENYKGLMKTYEKYHSHGLEILGFPCNQFGSQESGSESEIKSFCSARYNVNFPMFSKVDVNGPNTHPVYQFLKRELPEYEGGGAGKGPGQDLVWNFQKIIVNHEGRPVKRVYQAWEQSTVEQTVYELLHDARRAKGAAQ